MLKPTSPSVLIGQSLPKIDAIKTAAGLTDQQFAALCMPVLRSYAEHVQKLPLTTSAFSAPSGAWEFGLTAAMVAYRYAGTVIFFPTAGAEEKRLLEPQCRYMAFIAVLATAVAMVVESGSVVADDDEYHPLCIDTSLFDWLSSHHQRAKFTWRVPATPLTVQACAAIAAKFIPKGLLGAFDLRTVLMMYEAITPKATINGVESTIARVVRETVQRVTEHYRDAQAGTFQQAAVAGQVGVEVAAAEKLAKKMISAANPKILANPLEDTATAPTATPNPQPAATPAPASAASPVDRAAPTDSPAHAPAPTVSPPSPGQPAQVSNASGGDVLARANRVLREWFDALQQHQNFPKLKDQLEMTEEGITVPVAMLGMFGVSGPSIRKMMDDAGLVIRRSDDARGVILHPGLRDRFVSVEK